jgi:predicted dehydrogenase
MVKISLLGAGLIGGFYAMSLHGQRRKDSIRTVFSLEADLLEKFASGAISQIEVSWNFRGGMDLRDEVAGSEGTLRLDHWLRTGFEMFTSGNTGEYVSEKSESDGGWLFPLGDEVHALEQGKERSYKRSSKTGIAGKQ